MKTIGVIAPSGNIDNDKLQMAVDNLEKIGFRVKLSPNIFSVNRYLAGSDNDKIKALYELYEDSEIDIIMAARGGYGAIRLINKIDYNHIKNFSKPLIGFSDVTALLLMIYKNTKQITYHGPMVCSDFSDSEYEYSLDYLMKALNGEKIELNANKIYRNKNSKGILWGGNLATVVSLCGVDFILDEKFIFFTEDLNEPVYKIDKMFTQLFNINKFKNNCAGIILGDFLNVDNETWLEELFEELSLNYDIPILGGFPITHNKNKVTIPIGREAIIENNRLIF